MRNKCICYGIIIALLMVQLYNLTDIIGNGTLLDYLRVLLCDFQNYSEYGLESTNLITIFYYFILLSGGIWLSSEKISNYSRGYHSLMAIRYQSAMRYVLAYQKIIVASSASFVSLFLMSVMILSLIICSGAMNPIRFLFGDGTTLPLVFWFAAKMFLLIVVLTSGIACLIIHIKYEYLLLMSLILVGTLTFVSSFLQIDFFTFSSTMNQIASFVLYSILYCVMNASFLFIAKKKELV